MKITMVGTGYVGLVTGACLAKLGFHVTCADTDAKKIDQLKNGHMPIFEPGLAEYLNEYESNLDFTSDISAAVAQSDVIFVAVGTPPMEEGHADMSFVEAAISELAVALEGSTTIIIKSTVPVGTCRRLKRLIGKKAGRRAEFTIVSNPEFLREGSAIQDFMKPDRIVIGSDDGAGANVLREIYQPLGDDIEIIMTTLETSELIKYSANAFLATKVAFINEMANLCSAIGADVSDLSKGLGLDQRIGSAFLKPGPGYGGSCFPKDTMALTIMAQEADCPARIIESVVTSNSYHIRRLGVTIADFCEQSWRKLGQKNLELEGKKIAVLGLAFKANTDDIRSAASTVILPSLLRQGARVVGYDPAAMKEAQRAIPGLEIAETRGDAVRNADAILVLTEWDEFKHIKWEEILPEMNCPVVIDFRNLYDPEEMAVAGIYYYSLGRLALMPVS